MSAHTIEAVLTAKDAGMSSTFDKISGKAESFGSKLKSGLGFGVWSAIGQKAINSISSLINSSMDGAVKRFDTLNNFPKVMKSLGFGAKEAEASINKLGDGIAYLPTTLDKVASQTQQVVAVTGDLDQATRLTLALNNAMASGGQSAEQQASAINQWVQAMAKGKPDLQDWRALVQTAPAQMNQLAEATLGAGKTQSDLYDAMKSGAVSIDEVNAKMIELSEQGGKGITSWAEQAKSAGAGINMALTNVRAGVQRNLANIMGAVDSALSKVGGISGVIQKLVPAFDKVGSVISDVIGKKMSFEKGVNSLVKDVAKGAKKFVSKGADIASNLMKGLAKSAPSIMENMAGAMDDLMKTISKKAPKLVKAGADLVVALVSGLGKNLPKLLSSAGSMMLSFIGALGKQLPKLIVTGLNALTNLVKGLNNGTPALVTKAIQIGGQIVLSILKALPQILQAGLKLMAELLRGLTNGFAGIPAKVVAWAKRIPSSVTSGASSIVSVGKNIVKNLWSGISSLGEWLAGKAKSIGSKAVKGIKSGITGLAGIGKNIVKGLWGGAKDMVDWAVGKFKGLGKSILKGIKSALGIKSPSREFAEVGMYSVLGLVKGLEDNSRLVENATESLVRIPMVGMGNLAMDGAYTYGTSASYTIDVPLYINGREFARATAGDMQSALNTRETRISRTRGIR